MTRRPAAILTDIEGTTTPIAFVHRALFPFARARLPEFLHAHAANGAVAAIVDEVRTLAPGQEPLDALIGWMDADAKVTPLKELQGLIWREGYASGALRAELYPDVAGSLRAWHADGVRLAVYSSGSVEAQKLIFGHSDAGDLTPLFSGYFDTRIGGKREADSYRAILKELALPGGEVLFLSDVGEELDAAREAGLHTCQLLRDDKAKPFVQHAQARDFSEVRAP